MKLEVILYERDRTELFTLDRNKLSVVSSLLNRGRHDAHSTGRLHRSTALMERSVRGSIILVGGIVAVIALMIAAVVLAPPVHALFQPCHGRASRCVDSTHLEICEDRAEGPPTVGRCARCTGEANCERIADPAPGDVCGNGCGGTRAGAKPEEQRCSADGRTALSCAGCLNVWTATRDPRY
jgi:hypothetical protein